METILSMEIFEDVYTDLLDFETSGSTEYINVETNDPIFDNSWIFILAKEIDSLNDISNEYLKFLHFYMRLKNSSCKKNNIIDGYNIECLLEAGDIIYAKLDIKIGRMEQSSKICIKADYELHNVTTSADHFSRLYTAQKNFMRLIKMALDK